MGIVKYIACSTGKKFNIGEAIKDGWGLGWNGEQSLIGLKLQDRNNTKHKVEICSTDWFMGILRVFYKDGSWQCFDHCIEQFELDNN